MRVVENEGLYEVWFSSSEATFEGGALVVRTDRETLKKFQYQLTQALCEHTSRLYRFEAEDPEDTGEWDCIDCGKEGKDEIANG